MYRSGLEIKKAILKELKEGPKVVSQMERTVNTSDKVLKRHLLELEYLGIVRIIPQKKSPNTGRPYTVVELTH